MSRNMNRYVDFKTKPSITAEQEEMINDVGNVLFRNSIKIGKTFFY